MEIATLRRLVLVSLVMSLLLDLFLLYIGIESQKCDDRDDEDKKQQDENLRKELDELHEEVLALKTIITKQLLIIK